MVRSITQLTTIKRVKHRAIESELALVAGALRAYLDDPRERSAGKET